MKDNRWIVSKDQYLDLIRLNTLIIFDLFVREKLRVRDDSSVYVASLAFTHISGLWATLLTNICLINNSETFGFTESEGLSIERPETLADLPKLMMSRRFLMFIKVLLADGGENEATFKELGAGKVAGGKDGESLVEAISCLATLRRRLKEFISGPQICSIKGATIFDLLLLRWKLMRPSLSEIEHYHLISLSRFSQFLREEKVRLARHLDKINPVDLKRFAPLIIGTIPKSLDKIIDKVNSRTGSKWPRNSLHPILIIGSAFIYDEASLQRAIDVLRGGGILIGFQHGGVYGALEGHVRAQFSEYSLSFFCTYGYSSSTWMQPLVAFIPTISPLFSNQIRRRNSDKCLLTRNSNFLYVESQFSDEKCYLSDRSFPINVQLRSSTSSLVVSVLTKRIEILKRLYVRRWIGDRSNGRYPVDEIQRYTSGVLSTQLTELKGRGVITGFSGLVILDDFSTPFYERVAANLPLIVIHPRPLIHVGEFTDFYDALKGFGLIIEESWSDSVLDLGHTELVKRWYSEKLQEARHKFANFYCAVSSGNPGLRMARDINRALRESSRRYSDRGFA